MFSIFTILIPRNYSHYLKFYHAPKCLLNNHIKSAHYNFQHFDSDTVLQENQQSVFLFQNIFESKNEELFVGQGVSSCHNLK